MRASSVLAAAAVTSISQALSIPAYPAALSDADSQEPLASAEQYLIELAPGERRLVTEDEKWQLRREGKSFFDITFSQDVQVYRTESKAAVVYPETMSHSASVTPLLKELDKSNMRSHLETFTSFHTRYYKSQYGRQSSDWLFGQVNKTLTKAGHGCIKKFQHPWGQNSIIATLPGKSDKTVVIGAHQDSINLFLPSIFSAPGADDDGSGTVTILEALRVVLMDDTIRAGNASNTLEFHWYSAEEGGLLGSQAIFESYAEEGRDVKAMLQQDMTGYTQATLAAGEPESVGVIMDYVDPGLTDYIKKVIGAYCTIPYIETKCGYACSDHASASKHGYPSAFVIESDFKFSDKKIHTSDDKIEYLDFNHMLQHARMTLGLAYELAFADFS